MSSGTPADEMHPVFKDETFWYKLNVDYQEAENDVNDGEKEVSNLQDALLNHFVRRKSKVIEREESRFESVDEFKEEVKSSDSPEDVLMEQYVSYLWVQNNDGDIFNSTEDSLDYVESISDSGTIVREGVTDVFELLYPGNATIEQEIDTDEEEVTARRYLRANPVVLKKDEVNDQFEIRGRQGAQNKVSKNLRRDESVEEEKPEKVDESIVDKMESITDSYGEFKVIGVEFDSSSLPESSSIAVENDRPVESDINVLEEKDVISFDTMSQISKIKLRDTNYGGTFNVSVKHSPEGFRLELEASKKLDERRQRFREGFEEKTGIEFGKIYDYGSQDQRYIFNMILSGEDRAYQKYYENLDEQLKEFVQEAGDIREDVERKSCNKCSRQYGPEVDKCENCGIADFSDVRKQTVIEGVDDDRVAAELENHLSDLDPSHPKLDVLDWEVEIKTLSGSSIIETRGTKVQTERTGSTASYYQMIVVPIGNGRKPGKIDDYLLESILVTYGKSESRSYEEYGRLSLYDVLTADTEEKEELVGAAIYDSIIGLNDRRTAKAIEAKKEAQNYLELVDELGPMYENKDKLSEIYDPRKEKEQGEFEKSVFYLLNGAFPQTERWGELFEDEPDGLIAIPASIDDPRDYSVSIYDAKLSHAEKGYQLDKSEEDKTLRYIRTEEAKKRIQNITDDRGLSAHIFVSQNFNESRFETLSTNIRGRIDLYDGGESPDILFMEFKSLLELYRLTEEYWKELDDSRVRERFHELVTEELNSSGDESYVHFDEDSVSRIREGVIARADSFDDSDVKTGN